MKYKGIPSIALCVFLCVVAMSMYVRASAGGKSHNVESTEIVAINSQFSFQILELIRTNQTAKAQTMLENSVFLDLEQIWEWEGIEGVLSNKAAKETFEKVYPNLRQTVGLDRFQTLPAKERLTLTNFVKEADLKFLSK